MKAVFAAAQLGHAPSRFLSMGNIVDYPEAPERARRLLQGARTAGAQIHAARHLRLRGFCEAVHKPAYLQLPARAPSRNGAPCRAAVPNSCRASGRSSARSGARQHILGRAGTFLDGFRLPDHRRNMEIGAGLGLHRADRRRSGAQGRTASPMRYAVRPAITPIAIGPAASAISTTRALVAEHLRSKHERVAILDIDVHHGNGTQSIFYRRARVLTVSIHADPAEFYPFY